MEPRGRARLGSRGPAAAALSCAATLTADGRIDAWQTEMWVPRATANLEWVPLLAPLRRRHAPAGRSSWSGWCSQNGDPPYPASAVKCRAHWLGPAPLRPSNIRAPGKVANCFAVESFVDELAAKAKVDPLAFRLRDLADPRGVEVIRRVAQMIGWQARPSPAPSGAAARRRRPRHGLHPLQEQRDLRRRRDGSRGRARHAAGSPCRRVCCAHDCGLMINPDAVRAQVEGNILQTLSRTLYEETTFDRSRVTSVDWASYRLLRFPAVPRLEIALIDRRDQPPLGAGEAASSPVPGGARQRGVRRDRRAPAQRSFSAGKLKALLA